MAISFAGITSQFSSDWVKNWIEYLDYYLEQHDDDLFTDSMAWICLGAALGFSIVNWVVI